VAVDLQGHGSSPAIDGIRPVGAITDAVTDALDVLKRPLDGSCPSRLIRSRPLPGRGDRT
jgi:hypothetical protein